jgi:hypothetical protein
MFSSMAANTLSRTQDDDTEATQRTDRPAVLMLLLLFSTQ